ncbi:MAG: phosphoribosyltransferase family protein [bacterium]|nr:phosphoribosyltransferase family protein [bacterium]
MIHTLKYGYREALGMDLGIILGSRMIDEYSDTDAIVPIPLDKIRYKERGFNQSLCLAQGIAQVCQRAIYSRLLIRTVARAPQATLGVSARWENMEDVYSVVCTRDIPKRIILVDDVTTTGATLRSAARALRMAGAEKISALVFAHGIPPRHTPVR